jgi:hypothetical protein
VVEPDLAFVVVRVPVRAVDLAGWRVPADFFFWAAAATLIPASSTRDAVVGEPRFAWEISVWARNIGVSNTAANDASRSRFVICPSY